MKKSIIILSSVALLLTACGGSSSSEAKVSTPVKKETKAVERDENGVTITVTSNDDMKFSLSEIKVNEGEQVNLVLKHTGKISAAAMGHNIVILKQGVDVGVFAGAAMNAKENDFIPIEMEGDVIAHTKTIGGGETTSVTFTAPEKGTYDFLCSFPGHFAMMKGKFIVE